MKTRSFITPILLLLLAGSSYAEESTFDQEMAKVYEETNVLAQTTRPQRGYYTTIESNISSQTVDIQGYFNRLNDKRLGQTPEGKLVVALRVIARNTPEGLSADLIYRIRNRAEHIAGRDGPGLDRGFLQIRERIHNYFQPSVLDETRNYLRDNPNASAEVKTELRLLIIDLETMLGVRTDSTQNAGTVAPLGESLIEAEGAYKSILTGSLSGGPNPSILPSLLLNTSLSNLFVTLGLPEHLPADGKPLPLTSLVALFKTLRLEGLLKDKEEKAFFDSLAHVNGISADEDAVVRDFLKHVFAVAQARLEKNFSWMRLRLKTDEEMSNFLQEQIRSSSMLRLSQWIEILGERVAKAEAAKGKARYEASSPGSRCGTLRVIETEAQLNQMATGIQDILAVISEKPIEVTRKTPFGGLLSSNPMTEGSHAVILCRNMQRPCGSAALSKDEAAKIKALDGKLVKLDVAEKGYSIKPGKAVAAPKLSKAKKRIPLEKDLAVSGVQEISSSAANAKNIGVKAANYFVLTKVLGATRTQPGMALPFKHYVDAMKQSGLDVKVQAMLKEPQLYTDPAFRSQKLKELRDEIKRLPLPDSLMKELRKEIEDRFPNDKGALPRLRFRSSSNSEDLKWFSGAGLYDSAGLSTGTMDPDAKIDAGIADAVKTVWASVWSDSAFEGREEAGIDHSTVAMGVLIHPSYDDEEANGVALTGVDPKKKDLYRVAVNVGSYAVTNPEMAALPEVYEGSRKDAVTAEKDTRTFLRHSNVRAGGPVLTREQAEDLRGMVQKIHDWFGEPMEIEFKLMKDPADPKKQIIQVKQARPYRPKKK